MTSNRGTGQPSADRPNQDDQEEQFKLLLARDAISGLEEALARQLVPEDELEAALRSAS